MANVKKGIEEAALALGDERDGHREEHISPGAEHGDPRHR
jgi:hypothetical protein